VAQFHTLGIIKHATFMTDQSTINEIVREWMFSLPVLVVQIVGLVIAIGRRREYPKVAALVIISCALTIFTFVLIPVVIHVLIHIGVIRFTVIAVAWSLTGNCLAAVSAGLLIYAAFLGRSQNIAR
jgi:uncharacterized membrane protein